MTVVSCNIRFMRIFAGVPWKGGIKRQWGNRKGRFSGFSDALRHLRKWGQHYYTLLFSPLSPFHWPQITWPWMTLNVLIYVKFLHYYELTLRVIIYLFTVESVYIHSWAAEMRGSRVADRDPQNIWNLRKNCKSIRPTLIFWYYLVRYRLSSDSKTRDLEWPWKAISR